MRGNLLNGASTPVNAAASAGPVDKAQARLTAGASVTAATGLPSLAALKAVDAAMGSLQRSGLVTVAAVELAALGKTLDAMKYALAHAYIVIEGLAGELDTEAAEHSAILTLIEQTLGGKPQRSAQAPN